MLSSLITTLLATPALATDEISTSRRSAKPVSLDEIGPLNLGLDHIYVMPETNWIDSVTMTRIPNGSLHIKYDGPPKFALKIIRSQVRRFARTYHENTDDPHKLELDISGGPTMPWWTRSWFDSLTSDHGGAPDAPIIHTYGTEIRWRLGPFIISNMFRVRLRNVSALTIDADPQAPSTKYDPDRPPKSSHVAIRLEPDAKSSTGPNVKFRVRPSINISFPKSDEGWISAFRNLAIQAGVDIYVRGRVFISAEAEAGYSPVEGFNFKIGIVLGIW